jgi:hypothetical protein
MGTGKTTTGKYKSCAIIAYRCSYICPQDVSGFSRRGLFVLNLQRCPETNELIHSPAPCDSQRTPTLILSRCVGSAAAVDWSRRAVGERVGDRGFAGGAAGGGALRARGERRGSCGLCSWGGSHVVRWVSERRPRRWAEQARGLDILPQTVARLRAGGDEASVATPPRSPHPALVRVRSNPSFFFWNTLSRLCDPGSPTAG